MLRSLTALRVACLVIFLLPIAAAASNDPGIPDTVALELVDLSATAGDSVFAVEVWVFNDSQVRAVAIPIRWESGDARLDSASVTDEFVAAFDFIYGIYYKRSIDTSNFHNVLRLGGQSLSPSAGLPPVMARRKIATYYFTDTLGLLSDLRFAKIDSIGYSRLSYTFVAPGNTGYKPCFFGLNVEAYCGGEATNVLGLSNTTAYAGSLFFTTILTTDNFFQYIPSTSPRALWLSNGLDSIPVRSRGATAHNKMKASAYFPEDAAPGPWDLHVLPFATAEEQVVTAAVYVDDAPLFTPPTLLSPDRVISYIRYPDVALQTEIPLVSALKGYLLDNDRIADTFFVSHTSMNAVEFEVYGRLIRDWEVDSSMLTVALYDEDENLVYQADDAIHSETAHCPLDPAPAEIPLFHWGWAIGGTGETDPG